MVLSFNQIIKNSLATITKQDKKSLLFLLIFKTIVSIIDVASMIALVFVIAFYTHETSIVNTSFLPQWLLQKGSLYLFLIFIFFMVFKNWLALLTTRYLNQFVYKVALRISRDNLAAYVDESYEQYVKIDSSVPMRRIMYQPLEFCQYILAGSQQLITEIILIIITIGVIIWYKATLFLALFLVLFPLVLLISYLVKRKLALVRTHIKSSSEKASQHLREILSGFVEVNIYNSKPFFIERFSKEQERLGKYLPDLQVSQNMSSRLMEMFAILGLFLLFAANQYFGNPESGLVLNIGAFIAAAYKIIPGIIKILNLREQIKTFGFTTVDLVSSQPGNGGLIQSETINSLAFTDVTYAYTSKTILNKCNIRLRSGDFVGISSPSGSGKTTFINILLGFLEQQHGHVSINDVFVNAADRRLYWNKISYIKQQTFLIHDTVLKNITFNETTFDEKRLTSALKASGLDDMLKEFPEGLDKIIVENGKNISGGQRQRIAIARALYKDFDLIILDEPFNELDEASEIKILGHLQTLAANGKIILLVTHNKKSLSYCNKIIPLGHDTD